MAAPPLAWIPLRGLLEKRSHLYALLLLLMAAAAVRLAFLNQPMRYDEAYNFIAFTSRSLKTIVSDYHFPNNHVFHTLLMYLSYQAFGGQPWVLRLPALAAGILMVPAVYLAAALTYDRRTALLSAGLAASSSVLIEYSTNARGYTLVGLISLLIYILAIYSGENRRPAVWLMLVCLSAVGFYTIPILLYPFGAVMIWLIFCALYEDAGPGTRSGRLIYTISAAIAVALLTLLLYLPIIQSSGIRAIAGNSFVQPLAWDAFLANNLNGLRSTWQAWTRDLPPPVSFLFAAGFILALIFHRRLSRQNVPFVWVAIPWSLILLVAQRVAPWPRVWLFWLPFFLITAAAGILGLIRAALRRVRKISSEDLEWAYPLAVLVFTCLLSLKALTTRSPALSFETGVFPEAEETALFLSGYLQPGDSVLASLPADYPLRYYFWLHHIPKKYFYEPSQRDNIHRAIIITSGIYNQTAETVVAQEGLDSFLDVREAKSIYQDGSSVVYQLER